MAEKKVSEVVVKRETDFSNKEYLTNPNISKLSEELLSMDLENSLTIIDGENILQYAEEYPLIKYLKCNSYYQPTGEINSFIRKIVVSTALYGRKVSLKNHVKCELRHFDTVVYYEDAYGINRMIRNDKVKRFLLMKPMIAVSQDGILIFYYENKFLATVDCGEAVWVQEFSENIKYIDIQPEKCKISLVDGTENVLNFKLNLANQPFVYQED